MKQEHNSEYNSVPDVWSKLLLLIIEEDCFDNSGSLELTLCDKDGLTVRIEENGTCGKNECFAFEWKSTLGAAKAIVAWLADA